VINRPDIALALDVRSYETIAVVPAPDTTQEYPDSWHRIESRPALDLVNELSVVIVDRLDIQRKALAQIAQRRPRLLALFPRNVEQEKSMRRMISIMFPWSEVWTLSTSFGKALVTPDAKGIPYDRLDVIDARPVAEA
jgi:hypothetical protein